MAKDIGSLFGNRLDVMYAVIVPPSAVIQLQFLVIGIFNYGAQYPFLCSFV